VSKPTRTSSSRRPREDRAPVAIEGQNCWRRPPARRVAFLIDGENYYKALEAALERAERQVFILGWDFHRETKIAPSAEGHEAGLGIMELLERVVAAKPHLRVHVLDWDWAMIYVFERDPLPSLQVEWRREPRLQRQLDGKHPPGASIHHKVVVIDDRVAFCGGLDLTIRRWDTSEHAAEDPRRVDPEGKPYAPFHDFQVAVDGDAARALGAYARRRWRRISGEEVAAPPPPAPDAQDPWPPALEPDLVDVWVAIARTEAAWEGEPGVREIERLFLDAIARARRTIYLEAHIFSSETIVDALEKRLAEPRGPEVVIVGTCPHDGLVECAVGVLRKRMIRCVRAADVHGRLRACYPAVPGGADGKRVPVQVHSKILIIDDQHLHVGSANASNRSLGLDIECDLAIDATPGDEDVPRALRRLRERLLAEHLGARVEEVRRIFDETGSIVAVVDRLIGRPRTLVSLDDRVEEGIEPALPDQALLDPDTPYTEDNVVAGLVDRNAVRHPVRRLVLVLGGLLALGLAWKLTPLGDMIHPEAIEEWAKPLAATPLGPVVATLGFVVATLLLAPMTALTIGMAVLFGPAIGWVSSLVGCMASAAAGFGLGRLLWKDRESLKRGRFAGIARKLEAHGLITTAAVRLVPIAPFTVVNVVAGATNVRFRDFMLGNLLALGPGLLAMSFVADRIAAAVRQPSVTSVLVALAMLCCFVLLGRFVKGKLVQDDPSSPAQGPGAHERLEAQAERHAAAARG
jgi:phospholipase D1/2